MKTHLILRLVAAAFALLSLSSCDSIAYGTFGPGTGNYYQPMGGVTVASAVFNPGCGGSRPGYRLAMRPVPRGYGAVPLLPQGSCLSPGFPGNYPTFNQTFGRQTSCQPYRQQQPFQQRFGGRPNQCNQSSWYNRFGGYPTTPRSRVFDYRTGRWIDVF